MWCFWGRIWKVLLVKAAYFLCPCKMGRKCYVTWEIVGIYDIFCLYWIADLKSFSFHRFLTIMLQLLSRALCILMKLIRSPKRFPSLFS